MPELRRFVVAHPLEESALLRLRSAAPGVEIALAEPEQLPAALQGAQGVLLGRLGGPIDALLEAAGELAWIHTVGAGVDRLLTPKLIASPLLVTNSSGVHGTNIAEHLLGLMLAFARQFPLLWRAQQQAQWTPPPLAGTFELAGQTLVIVGLGAIGEALALRAHALGLRVLGVRRNGSHALPVGVERVYRIEQLDDALAQADHVAVTLPLTPATHGLFDAARIAAIKPGAYFYNVGRGELADQAALLAALDRGALAGLGLDVTTPEPLPADSPLWRHPNVFITSHTSGGTPYYGQRLAELVAENLQRFRTGQTLLNLVDKHAGY
ncbi:Phosphoglycerate dehydrogenase [Andreprevotia lacus DSM 23236]|uniref:Phosphoglycerate dehydrogenase n=1 Tax=Andreprevotia lacus DSM 23236 TaxID=1121001 RepID=A0A1W1XGC0_9NEIS|nr:D-2-hydroxyacid dehydrogenase [Andreprevotia lacus]SMC22561.1 Phosphoglycerate dehydrogenase [Andreprevotia lacus DSM 23236]